jgi:hypothetical protein
VTEKMRGPYRVNGHLGRQGPLTDSSEVARIRAEDAAYYAQLEDELDPTRPADWDLLADTELGHGK